MSSSSGAARRTSADVVNRVAADFPRTGLFILVTTYAVLFLLLRSVVLPAKALVMNTLSIVASFGALVWIFQDGNLSSLLGFQPLGFVETTQPVILFCVLFGLSMDYEVFLLSRMKEVWDRTGDNQEAVARGLERSGRIVTSAALIVVVVASSFAFADIVLIKALGIGMAIAVALDATVVRALLVPATMRLLGDWNWWLPRALRRVPRIETAGLATAATLALVVLLVAGCAGAPILANPPAAHPTAPAATPAPIPAGRPAAGRPSRGRRSARPADRVVVRHGPSPDVGRPALRLRVRDLPGGARRPARVLGLARRDHRRDRTDLPVRPAHRDRAAGRTARRPTVRPVDRARTRGAAGASLATAPVAWTMTGGDGRDHLVASAVADPRGPAGGVLGLDLRLTATKPPALHNRIGWIDFAEGGSSYYYSRTAMSATGSITARRADRTVTGEAWFDHQWGDFIAVGGGGWDWFAVNLADGTDLTLSLVRNADGSYPLVYGTLVDADGRTSTCPGGLHRRDETGHWQSPATGADYPAGWRIRIPAEGLEIDLSPTVADQELDTRASTGVIYWEGSQHVAATRNGTRLGGEAYVELTGYAPVAPAAPTGPVGSPVVGAPGASAP